MMTQLAEDLEKEARLDATYWKPIQAGLAEGTDSEKVAALADVGSDRIVPEAYGLRTPCFPHEPAGSTEC